MRKVHPIHFGATGPDVANLHNVLLFIFFNEPGGASPENRKALQARLAPDVIDEKYGDATTELVGMWQNQLKNWPNFFPPLKPDIAEKVRTTIIIGANGRGNGDVDEVTAEAMNWFIGKLRGH